MHQVFIRFKPVYSKYRRKLYRPRDALQLLVIQIMVTSHLFCVKVYRVKYTHDLAQKSIDIPVPCGKVLGPCCKQECIPVGCVPAAHWPYAVVCFPRGVGCLLPGGVCSRGGLLWGVSAPGGVCSRGCCSGGVCSGGCLLRGCLLPGGVCSGGCLLGGVCLGVSAWGGVCSRGCLLLGGWYHSMHRGRPPVNRITDMSKNITLATTSLWLVKIL